MMSRLITLKLMKLTVELTAKLMLTVKLTLTAKLTLKLMLKADYALARHLSYGGPLFLCKF